jgi:predicted metal-dependent peptidase
VKDYTREDLPIQDDSGYGGTRLMVPFDYVKENVDRNPTAMIICSDMEAGDFPEVPPPFPVLWVSTQPRKYVEHWWPNNDLPFGEFIEIIVEHKYC